MDKVKHMVYQVVARTLSLEAFETWLYQDKYVNNQILDNAVILELLSIDLKSRHAITELEQFCFYHFDREECLAYVVKFNVQMLLDDSSDKNIEILLRNIARFHDWNEDFQLISQVYWFDDQWGLALEGLYSKTDVMNQILAFAAFAKQQLSLNDIAQLKQILRDGLDVTNLEKGHVVRNAQNNAKKWFEFWK